MQKPTLGLGHNNLIALWVSATKRPSQATLYFLLEHIFIPMSILFIGLLERYRSSVIVGCFLIMRPISFVITQAFAMALGSVLL